MFFLGSSIFLNCLSGFAIISVSIYFYIGYKLSYWKRKGIPSPPTHWLFGNFKDAILGRTSVGDLLGKLHKEAGDEPFIGIYVMHKPLFLMRDPELIKQILVKDFHIFQNRYFSSAKSKDLIGSTGLFSIDNPKWKYLRTKLSPAFSTGKQKKLFALMIETSENMRNFLDNQFNESEKVKNVDTYIVAVRYITDVISSLAYGVKINSFGNDQEYFNRSHEPFKKSFIGSIWLFAIFFFPALSTFISIFNEGILGSSTNYFRNLFWDVMNQREKSGTKRGDTIDSLLQIKNERDQLDFEIPDDTLLAQPVIFSIAGTETTSITIAQTLMELAKNPVLQGQVRQNIKEELEKHGFTYEGIQEMKLLYQAISETMRLYPAEPIIDRVALQDYKIPGTDIVLIKGTAVYAALNGLHEDPRFHKDPLKYDPDRFSEERKSDIVPCTYMPFGIGPRSCIGERVGMLLTAVGIATMLRDYEVSLNPLYKNELDPRAIFVLPLDGVNLDFKKFNETGEVKNVDSQNVSIRCVTDVISSLAYGMRTNSFGNHEEFFNCIIKMLFLGSSIFLNLLGAFAFISISIHFYSGYKLRYWKRKGVRSPPTHWLFGNFKDAILGRISVGDLLGKLHKEAGDEPFIGIYIVHKPFLLIRDPELIKQVFVKDFQIFQNRYFSAVKSKDLIASTGIFSINNPEWKYLRNKLSPAFSSGKQKKLFSLMIESSENMRNFLCAQFDETEKVKNVDSQNVSIRYVTDVISSLAYGVRTNSFGNDHEFFNRNREPLEPSRIGSFMLFLAFFFPVLTIFTTFFDRGILGSSTKYFRTLFWDVMNQREKSGNKRGDAIDPLLEIKNERDKLDFEIPDDTLLAQSVNLSLAGTESSSATIALTLMQLAKNPVFQDRVRKNIQEEVGKHGFTYEGIQGMTFLYQAISETMRLYTAVPMLDRVALQNYTIPGTDIVLEKGTPVYVSFYGLHEDPRFYKDPLKYDPDRFSEEKKGDIVPCTYIPFGIGPRACIGERVGMLQVAVGLATILGDYKVALSPLHKYELDPRALFLQVSSDGVKLDFKKVSN
ncbi:uncharacterized protein LOC117178462 [Belonocnema kinseyi]|uniref:uncharacterized protein LOC117178462 n=1 Tax=Belonocnema kinseyi TaxID=2817044 RepID=UPI00143D5B4D|nr:uncharacterized protein LOC117178462 [Belonocnema kinseyi]